MKEKMRILFIGNSHTYFNDMPAMVAAMAREADYDCEVTMIAHGGWYLEQHVQEPDVRFNILYGHYDYVVLQEHSHPFASEDQYFGAVRTLNTWIQEAGSRPVVYMTWARKAEEFNQPMMTEANEKIAAEINAVLAPVGADWWQYRESHPDIELFYEDGSHASPAGSEFAAGYIWTAIRGDLLSTK